MSITGNSSIRRLKDCPVVMDLHELSPVDRRTTGGRDGRRLERFAEVCQNFPDRARIGNERDEFVQTVQRPSPRVASRVDLPWLQRRRPMCDDGRFSRLCVLLGLNVASQWYRPVEWPKTFPAPMTWRITRGVSP